MIITITIYGRSERCELLERHSAGTIDVMRLRDGACFRVSGLQLGGKQ